MKGSNIPIPTRSTVNVNYFQEAWIFYPSLRDTYSVYIGAQVYGQFRCIQSHVYRKRVKVQMITDGVPIGNDRLAKIPCLA